MFCWFGIMFKSTSLGWTESNQCETCNACQRFEDNGHHWTSAEDKSIVNLANTESLGAAI